MPRLFAVASFLLCDSAALREPFLLDRSLAEAAEDIYGQQRPSVRLGLIPARKVVRYLKI
jgi:hypothetical protein